MTFQPPPPPPPPPPAGPPPGGLPPGAWGPPGRPSQPFDPKSVNQLDWAIVGLGALLFIFSFFSYYTASYAGISDSAGAWHVSGGAFIAWLAMVCSVLGAAAVALALFMPQVSLPLPQRLLGLGLAAIGSLLYIIAIFAHPKFFDVGGLSFGHGFSFWISLVFSLALTAISLMRLQQTGGQLPGRLANMPNIGGHRPGGPAGQQSGYAPPVQSPPPAQGPPPGYAPPPQPPQAGP